MLKGAICKSFSLKHPKFNRNYQENREKQQVYVNLLC